jgi:hypothetical protein
MQNARNESSSANKGFFLSSAILDALPKEPVTMTVEDFLRNLATIIPTDVPPVNQDLAKTSPGPWKFKGNGLLHSNGKLIGTFHNSQSARRASFDNRNLVLQAPALLDFCRKVADTFTGADDPLGKEARTLVDKAQP